MTSVSSFLARGVTGTAMGGFLLLGGVIFSFLGGLFSVSSGWGGLRWVAGRMRSTLSLVGDGEGGCDLFVLREKCYVFFQT